jgi:AraC family transcriptional regulator of arabinose operon
VTGLVPLPLGASCWREHGVKDWLFMCSISGEGTVRFEDGRSFAQPQFDLVLIRPWIRHDYCTTEGSRRPWNVLWYVFQPRPEWLALLDWPAMGPGILRLRIGDPLSRRAVIARLNDVHRLATGRGRHRAMAAMNALESALLMCDAHNPNSEQARLDPRLRRAMDFICRNLARPLQLGTIAGSAGISVSHLLRLFRHHAGTSPSKFVELQRLERARQMLEATPLTVQSIAWEVGFENPFYFTQRFKRQTGLSPREFRRKSLDNHRRRPIESAVTRLTQEPKTA